MTEDPVVWAWPPAETADAAGVEFPLEVVRTPGERPPAPGGGCPIDGFRGLFLDPVGYAG